MASNTQLFIAYDTTGHYLVSTRGILQLMTGDAVRSFQNEAGLPVVTVDAGTMKNLRVVFDNAP